MKILEGRVLIKKLKEVKKSAVGLDIPSDNDSAPIAEIVLVSKEVEEIVSVGDKVYYMESREKGKCPYKGEEHFIISIGNILAII